MKKLVGIIGAGGLIGSELVKYLSKDFQVRIVKSSMLYGDTDKLAISLEGTDFIINLAGFPIAGRWNRKVKNLIYASRIDTTKNLVKAVGLMKKKPIKLLNASAVGLYADGLICDETSLHFANNYLAKVVIDWEKEAYDVLKFGTKLCILRFGVVLSNSGGAFKILRKIFWLGIGGVIGNGKQGFSFILIDDVVRIVHRIISTDADGIFNVVCPQPSTNSEFSHKLASSLNRPCVFKIPSFVLRLVLREGSSTLLVGQKVIPARLHSEGYQFIGNNLKECLNNLVK